MGQRTIRMTRAARLGLLALVVAILATIAVYVAVQKRSTGGYRMGVHFRTAAGLAPGALVFFNGVNIGNVRRVRILPDTTVDVILNVFHATDIPKNAQFSVQSTFTGSPTIAIVVPKQRVTEIQSPTPLPQSALLPKRIVPVAEQPVGTTPLSIEDVMAQGKALGARAQRILSLARPYGGRLMNDLQGARANGAATSQEMRTALPSIMASLKTTIAQAKANASRAQSALRGRDQAKLAATAAAFQRSASDMSSVSSSLTALKNDPRLHADVRVAAAQLRTATANMAGLTHDMAFIAKNAQTKAELRDAGARFHDVLAHLKSLIP